LDRTSSSRRFRCWYTWCVFSSAYKTRYTSTEYALYDEVVEYSENQVYMYYIIKQRGFLSFSFRLSTFDLCTYMYMFYTYKNKTRVSNQKFSSTVDRWPLIYTKKKYVYICSTKRKRWYKIQYIYIYARMYGLPVCRCVPNNRNNITKPVASER